MGTAFVDKEGTLAPCGGMPPEDPWAELVLLAQHQQTLPPEQQDGSYAVALMEEFDNLIQAACRKFRTSPSDRSDLLQEALFGLVKAIYTFNPTLGFHFAGYAKAKINQAAWQFIRSGNRTRHREQPDTAAQGEDGTRATLLESLTDPQAEQAFSEAEWRSLLASLSDREALVIEQVVIDGLSMAELARRENVSADTVKTWKQRAFVKIRKELERLRADS